MPLSLMPDFSFKHVNQPDRPTESASTRKAQFDSRGVELRDFINSLVTKLNSTIDGDSGMDNISGTPVAGLDPTANTAQRLIEALKSYVDADKATKTELTTHTGNTSNPHSVTAAQVGAIAQVAGISNPGGNISITGGTGITIGTNADTKTVTITATGTAVPGPHAAEHGMYGTDPITPALIGAAGQAALDAHLAESAQKELKQDLNIIDMAVELETLKGATLNGVTANIFVETFSNLNDITLSNGVYDSTNKRVYLP